MRIYIMLPFTRVVWASLDYDFQTASITEDYAGCFKTMGIYKFKPEDHKWTYTIIDPKTLSLC